MKNQLSHHHFQHQHFLDLHPDVIVISHQLDHTYTQNVFQHYVQAISLYFYIVFIYFQHVISHYCTWLLDLFNLTQSKLVEFYWYLLFRVLTCGRLLFSPQSYYQNCFGQHPFNRSSTTWMLVNKSFLDGIFQ